MQLVLLLSGTALLLQVDALRHLHAGDGTSTHRCTSTETTINSPARPAHAAGLQWDKFQASSAARSSRSSC